MKKLFHRGPLGERFSAQLHLGNRDLSQGRVDPGVEAMSTGLSVFTLFHVALSLVGILAGFVVVYGLLTAKLFNRWTAVFLWTTVLTSVTGFFFPFHKLLPSHILGIISLVLLPIAIYARYSKKLAGAWNPVYSITACSPRISTFSSSLFSSLKKYRLCMRWRPRNRSHPSK